MDIKEITRVLDEAVELGVSVIMFAGGEPMLKEGILSLPETHKSILYVMFTNGLLLDNLNRELPMNLIPVISIEGGKEVTDKRRGSGIFDKVTEIMRQLDKDGRLFGASVTLTSKNFSEVIETDYLNRLESIGCRVVFSDRVCAYRRGRYRFMPYG